jgi:hypothetical protein
LTVESGFVEFAYPPYTANARVVVFDNTASCGSGCTAAEFVMFCIGQRC